MSRTFELLQRVQQDQELFRVPAVTQEAPASGRSTSRPTKGKVSLPDLDAFAAAEILRLVQCLFLATNGNGRNGPRRVVFCGIEEGDSSNLLCARVGRSLAEQVQSHVCVVNANVVVRTNRLFDMEQPDSPAVAQSGITEKRLQRVTGNLWLISSDSIATKGGAPALEQMRACIKDLDDGFAYVVISAPPIALYSDAALLGEMAEGVVLVLEANSTRRVTARRAKEALEATNARILGTVLNNRTFSIPEKIYRLL